MRFANSADIRSRHRRARGFALPRSNPTAEFWRYDRPPSSRATTSPNAQFWSAPVRPARGHRHRPPADRSDTETTAGCAAPLRGWHRPAAESAERVWAGNRLQRLRADRCRRPRNSLCRGRYRRSCRRRTLPYIEFEFPAAPILGYAPEFEHAGFRDLAFERYRNDLLLRIVFIRRQEHFDGREFFELIRYVFEHFAGAIVFARERREEAELSRLAHHKRKSFLRQLDSRALFQTERHHGECLHGCRHARHS